MEHFTQSITDDFADYNGNRETMMNGVSETGTTREGEAQSVTKEIDVDAILNRAPIRRHRRSRPLEEGRSRDEICMAIVHMALLIVLKEEKYTGKLMHVA